MPAPPRTLVIFGTRPEAIKLFPVVAALRALGGITVRTCVTAQHRALLDQIMSAANIVPDIDLDLMEPNQSLDRLTARLLTGLGRTLDAERPDRVIVQGDTATAMVGALAAHYHRIPVSHVEAGLRSGDNWRPWPEEVNRKIIATIADQNFAPTSAAANALRRENIDPATIYITGNTSIDALLAMRARIAAEPALAAGLESVERRFSTKKLILVTAHRRESFGAGMEAIAQAITRIADRKDAAILFPMHPNPNVTRVMDRMIGDQANIARVPPLQYPQFIRALGLCHLVLTDSGGVQEEAPVLGKPVLVMRDTTERPEGIVAGTARLVGADCERIIAEVERLLDDEEAYLAMARAHNPFGDGNAAGRIAAIVAKSLS